MFGFVSGLMSYWLFLVLCCLFSLVFDVMIMLAIGFDLKSRGSENTTVWMILAFFFPVITGIVYAFKRDGIAADVPKTCVNCNHVVNAKAVFCSNCGGNAFTSFPVPGKEKNTKNKNIALTIGIVAIVISIMCSAFAFSSLFKSFGSLDGFFDRILDEAFDYDWDDYDDYDWEYQIERYGYDVDGKTVYYDMKGNSYSDANDVLLYDSNSTAYKFDSEDQEFETKDGKEYNMFCCYLDENGYLFYDGDDKLFSSAYEDYYLDTDGNRFYYFENVSWNKDGKMVDNYSGEIITPKENNQQNNG